MLWNRIIRLSAIVVSCVGPRDSAGELNDDNLFNIDTPDLGAQVSSDLLLVGVPSNAYITSVQVYFEIRHTCPNDSDVWLTFY